MTNNNLNQYQQGQAKAAERIHQWTQGETGCMAVQNIMFNLNNESYNIEHRQELPEDCFNRGVFDKYAEFQDSIDLLIKQIEKMANNA